MADIPQHLYDSALFLTDEKDGISSLKMNPLAKDNGTPSFDPAEQDESMLQAIKELHPMLGYLVLCGR